MISERSRDTKDWSYGCWKFSFAIYRNILHFIKLENYSIGVFSVFSDKANLSKTLNTNAKLWTDSVQYV